MSIIERKNITEAYRRAVELGGSHEEACITVARALALDEETVARVVAPAEEQAVQP